MNLEGILAIGGKPGLYKLVAQSRSGVIVEHLTEGKRLSIGAQAQVSALQDIALYTWDEEKPLREIFEVMLEKHEGGKCLSPKSSARELETYFSEVLPDYDTDRVYPSDIKKVLSWYNALLDTGLLTAESEESSEPVEDTPAQEEDEEKEA